MPENVNTTPLSSLSIPTDDDNRPVMVSVDHVSMIFNMASEQLNSLKEYAIALAKRELMFKEFRALDDVSFEVRKGDVFGILGTNGSGKSTVLKIVAGVLEPSKGSCSINGNIAPLIELGAGFDMELTARENIYLNGALLGYSRKFIDQHFDEIVDFAEVEKFLDMPMKNYSSGMVARIAFAIATIIVPDILIVDEVLSVGDFMFQQKCERRIQSLIKEHDVTVLIVSHSNDQIERLCNKAIWIEKGHMRMMGSAREVCRTYRALGGHVGGRESEERVFETLRKETLIPEGVIASISGETRFSLAAKLTSNCRFAPGGVTIITPETMPSTSLAATALAGVLDAAILPTRADELPDTIAQELRQLQSKRVLVAGSEKLISEEVTLGIKAICPDACTTRLCGDTPETIALQMHKLGLRDGEKSPWSRTAIVTYDECTGDLTSFAPFIHQNRIPVFFTKEWGVIGEETSCLLKSGAFDHLLILGGGDHIPDSFLSECLSKGISSERICGENAYHANETINNRIMPSILEKSEKGAMQLIVTSAWNPLDAAIAGPYAAKERSMFLLDDPQSLDSVAHAISYIKKQQGSIKRLVFLGDDAQFSPLDKEILGKAVVEAWEGSAS